MADLKRTLENSVIDWLGKTATHSQTLGITPANAVDDDALTLPALVVRVTVGDEHIFKSGVYDCTIEISYHWQSDDTTASTGSTLWGKVGYIMRWDDLAARLSDAANLTVWGVTWGAEEHEIIERNHIQRLTINAIAQPS